MGTKTSYESEISEEASKLNALFKEKSKLSQAEFGSAFDIGTQGMVSQYLMGRRPLNVPAAIGFARGLGVQIFDFSPRISKLIREASDYNGQIDRASISPESASVLRLLEPLPPYEQKRMAEIIKTITTTEPLSNDEVERKMPATKRSRPRK